MEPLDLRTRPPRPPREELGGIIFLPRAIDKARASLPGGHLGTYLVFAPGVPTMSSVFYRKLGIEHDAFVQAVGDASGDDALLAWLLARIDPAAPQQLRERLLGLRVGDLPPLGRAAFNALYAGAASAAPDALIVDLIDTDDRTAFATLDGD